MLKTVFSLIPPVSASHMGQNQNKEIHKGKCTQHCISRRSETDSKGWYKLGLNDKEQRNFQMPVRILSIKKIIWLDLVESECLGENY